MAEWVYVENNEIKEYHDILPKSWKHISGLDKADDIFLKDQGWYRVVKNYQIINEELEELIGYKYEIHADHVVETLEVKLLSEEEIDNRNKREKQNFFTSLRSERNRLLKESDWSQVVDLQTLKSQDWINSWKTYRQQLRDLPIQYENVEDYKVATIRWPYKPEG